ncbi:hypothetical protein BO94DRAFT_589600 [Aspergillus sclerotioniger CBS 115572]|uniref:Nephrocystin 3-like N-terminal domain-containing protein n=1 Tax=Aspergillus sclerotioniger CBS 115572 TaxID=1450535 RepID=A0A317VH09_9EURO|nr:hypothetical protein BO94DRAFT_589600 [Aspergillus sclerotioniger CBS 115572]PWY72447.1 hypothetical protein BO94DRAFT_589600 [Aspergillus sclerotioniger CBS 115572]
MLARLCAKLCCSQTDTNADEAQPAILHANSSAAEWEGPEPTSKISCDVDFVSSDRGVEEPKDLWQVAFDSLDPERKRWLSKEDKSPVEVIERVIGETKNKYEEYRKKSLVIRRPDGSDINKVVESIVSFDPSGHASSAWAIVSLGLTMVQRNIYRRDAIFESSEYLADKLAYFTIIDSESRYKGCASDEHLEDALTGVYSAILEYAAEVSKTHKESAGARIGSTLIPLTEQPLQKLRTVVDAKATTAKEWASMTDRSHLKKQVEDILTAVDKNTENLQEVHLRLLSKLPYASGMLKSTLLTGAGAEGDRILELLSKSDYSTPQNNSQYHRTKGTGDWIAAREDYQQWKARPGSIFWLHGVAGCGKSVMCSTMMEADVAAFVKLGTLSLGRPLTLEEVAAAVRLKVPEHIINIFKEFLVASTAKPDPWYHLSILWGQTLIAQFTLETLLTQKQRLSEEDVGRNPILEYAACNWHDHFKGVATINPDTPIQTMVDDLFCDPTAYRNWQYILTEFDELEAQPTPVGAASELGLVHTVNMLLEQGADPLEMFTRGRKKSSNAVFDASQAGHLDVLDLLLKRCSLSLHLAKSTLERIESRSSEAKTLHDIMETLSDSGVLFVEPRGQDIRIDERIVIAAASNRHYGLELMTILLDQFGGEGVAAVPINEQVLAITLKNEEHGSDILELLLKTRGADVQIYPRIRELLASTHSIASRAVEILLEARLGEISLDENFIAGFAKHATVNDCGADVMRRLLSRQEHRAQVSERVLCTAAKQGIYLSSVEILGVLLGDCGADFPLGENVMLAALSGGNYATQIIEMFLCRQQAGFTVSPAVLAQAASHSHGAKILELLMNNGGLRVPITEEILVCAASKDGKISYLLDLEEKSQIQVLPITDQVLVRAVGCLNAAILQRLFRRRPQTRVTGDMFVAGCNKLSKLSLLLQQPHDQLPIMQMMQGLLRYPGEAREEVIKFLLDENFFDVDERFVEIFAEDSYVLEILLQSKPNLLITERAVIKAAQNKTALSILLDKRIDDLPISSEVMVSVARSYDPVTSNLRRILKHFGSRVPITEAVLVAAAFKFEVLQLLLQAQVPNLDARLSEEVVFLATYSNLSALPWLLQEHGSAVPLTENVLVAAAANSVFGLDCDFCDISYSHKFNNASISRKLATENILRYTRAVDVSEEVFEQASTASGDGKECALYDLLSICIEEELPVRVTEQLKALVLRKADAHDIEDLCESFSRRGKFKDAGALLKMLISLIPKAEEALSVDS